MAKGEEVKLKMIELLAKGGTIRAVAKELGVAPKTIIEWSKDLKFELENARALELQDFHDKHLLSYEKKWETFSKIFKDATDQLQSMKRKDSFQYSKLLDAWVKLYDMMNQKLAEPNLTSVKEINFMKEDDIDIDQCKHKVN